MARDFENVINFKPSTYVGLEQYWHCGIGYCPILGSIG